MRLYVRYATHRYKFENPEELASSDLEARTINLHNEDNPSEEQIKEAIAKLEGGFAPGEIHLRSRAVVPELDIEPDSITFRELLSVLNEDPAVQKYRSLKEEENSGWKLYEEIPLNYFAKIYGIEARHLERISEQTHHTTGELVLKNGKEIDIYIAP